MRQSATLVIDDGANIACMACGYALGPAGEPWKQAALLDQRPMRNIAGGAYTNAERVLLRRLFCPGCGALLDTEVALEGDPFLNDAVRP